MRDGGSDDEGEAGTVDQPWKPARKQSGNCPGSIVTHLNEAEHLGVEVSGQLEVQHLTTDMIE